MPARPLPPHSTRSSRIAAGLHAGLGAAVLAGSVLLGTSLAPAQSSANPFDPAGDAAATPVWVVAQKQCGGSKPQPTPKPPAEPKPPKPQPQADGGGMKQATEKPSVDPKPKPPKEKQETSGGGMKQAEGGDEPQGGAGAPQSSCGASGGGSATGGGGMRAPSGNGLDYDDAGGPVYTAPRQPQDHRGAIRRLGGMLQAEPQGGSGVAIATDAVPIDDPCGELRRELQAKRGQRTRLSRDAQGDASLAPQVAGLEGEIDGLMKELEACALAPHKYKPAGGAQIAGGAGSVQQGGDEEEEEADDPRDMDVPGEPASNPPALDEDEWRELQEAWRKKKEDEDRRLREELDRIRDEMDKRRKALEDEEKRRKQHPERERNARERARLERERERLDKERRQLEEDRDKLDQRAQDDNQLDKDLRRAEQEERQRDPNCRGASCREIQRQRADLQQRRVDQMKDGQQIDRRAQNFDRDNRNFQNDARAYEDRLDRGVGLTHDEHQARMEEQRAEAARAEFDDYNKRWLSIHSKINRGEATREEVEEYNRIGRNMDSLRSQTEGFERSAVDQINQTFEKQGGSFLDQRAFVEEAENDRQKLAPGGGWKKDPPLEVKGDGLSFDQMDSTNLQERSDRLGRAIDQVDEARSRVGLGGDQPVNAGRGQAAMDTAKAEIEKQNAELENLLEQREAATLSAYGFPAGGVDGTAQRVNKANAALEKARAAGADPSELERLQNDVNTAQRAHRAAVRDLDRVQGQLEGTANDLNQKIDFFNDVNRHEAVADDIAKTVADYNSGFGNTVDARGQFDPDALRDNLGRFEQNARSAQQEQARVGALEEIKQNLRRAPPGGQSEGQRLGLSESDIARHEETLNAQILQAQTARDQALGELQEQGFVADLDANGKLRVGEAPNWARVFGQASQQVIDDRATEAERIAKERLNPPPALEAPRQVERVTPEMAEARAAEGAEQRAVAMAERERQAQERNEAALSGGYEAWRAVQERQKQDEVKRLQAAPQLAPVEQARLAKLEGELQQDETARAAEHAQQERMNEVWMKWGDEIAAERKSDEITRDYERAARVATPASAPVEGQPPSPLEVERDTHLSDAATALGQLERDRNVEGLRERRDQLERDYMDNRAARMQGERTEVPDAGQLSRLDQQGERILKQLEDYQIALRRVHEAKTEGQFEEDARRAAEQMVEWDQVRDAAGPTAPQAEEKRAPVQVAQVEGEGQLETPRREETEPTGGTRERTPQPAPSAPSEPTPPEGGEGENKPAPGTETRPTPTPAPASAPTTPPTHVAGERDKPRVEAGDEAPADAGEPIVSDGASATDEARARFKDWVRDNLRGLVDPSDPASEALPEIVANLADRFGAENAAKLVVDALARLRNRRSIYGSDVVLALFDQAAVESERANGAEGKRLAQLGQIEFLDALLNDPRLANAFGITSTERTTIQQKLGRLAGEAARSAGEAARTAEQAGKTVEELQHLATQLHLATLMSADPAERAPILRRISEVQQRLLQGAGEGGAKLTDPAATLGVSTSIAESLRGALARLPKNAGEDEKTALVEELARSQRLRRFAAQQIGRLDPKQREVARIVELDATSAEARALVGMGRVGEAAALLRGLRAGSPAEIAIRAQALAPILALAERIHGFASEAERSAFGSLEALREERKRLLDDWLAAESDEDQLAAIALERARIANQENKPGEALATLDRAITRAPDNPILRGMKLVAGIGQLSGERPAGEIARLIEAIPADAREGALTIALDELGMRGDLRALDSLRAILAQPGFEEMRGRLAMRERLARIDALDRAPSEANDREIDRLLGEARGVLDTAGFDAAAKQTMAAALEAIEASRKQSRELAQAAGGSNAPPEGWTNLARQALQSGRLDLAEKALVRQIGQLGESADRAGFVRGMGDVVGLLQLVRSRADDPSLNAEQRDAARAFVERVGQQAALALDAEIATSRIGYARLAKNNLEQRPNQTEERKNRNTAQAQSMLDDLRAMVRLRGMARTAGLPPAERDALLGQLQGEVGERIRGLEAEIRQQFGGLGKEVEQGQRRLDLEEKLGQLDALRAERDAYRDLVLARNGSQSDSRTLKYSNVSKSNLEWELYDLDRELNGYTEQENKDLRDAGLRQSYGARGRLRGASGWRKFGELTGDDRDRQLDTILYESEVAYLEQRRFDLVMNAPHLSREQKRTRYEEILRVEAARWDETGKNISPLLFPELNGLGHAEIALARAQNEAIGRMRLRNHESDYNEAVKRGDPQAAFQALVQIREASLAGEFDKYVDYLNTPWYRRGPVRGVRTGLYAGETGQTLEDHSVDMAKLHSALIRAAHRPVNQLSAEDRSFLSERGFIVNGRYAIPEGIELKPTQVATNLANEGKLAVVDRYVNAAFAAELAATVILPGGVSARIASGTLTRVALAELVAEQGLRMGARNALRVLATREGAKWAAAWGGERALEAAFFTALSRGAKVAIDPELILDEKAWTFGALGSEYLHNLAVISTLRVGGGALGAGSNAARRYFLGEGARRGLDLGQAAFEAAAGTATALGEAAILTGLNRAFSSNAITSEDFIGNLLTVGMMRGLHGLEGIRERTYIGGRAMGEARIGLGRAEAEAYHRWMVNEYLPETQYIEQQLPTVTKLLKEYNGSWDALRAAYERGEVPEAEMHQVFVLRKSVIDALAREIVGELGGDVQAFGSAKLTSDYDLSFYGPRAELAVILFNARFNNAWRHAILLGGAESATRLDVNFYTNPVFDAFRGGANDVFHQDAFAHMANRKYMDDAQWAEYRGRLLENSKPELREQLSKKLDEIEASVRRNSADIEAFEAQIRRELGQDVNEADVGWAARNRLYERSLQEIMRLKEAYDKAGSEAERAEIAQQLRDAQSNALYFAAEAYQTDAAIKHVVFTIQAAKRAITVESLTASGKPELSIPMTEAQGRQSYFEQMANIYKEFNHHAGEFKLASKTAKYFIRALDAARIAGLEFTPEMRKLIEETVHLDGIRNDAAAVEAYLKSRYKGENAGQQYMDAVRKLLGDLSGELARRT